MYWFMHQKAVWQFGPQNDPHWLPPLGIHVLVWSPPTLTRADLCGQQNIVEMTVCDFQGQVLKDNTASNLHPPGSLLPYCKVTQAALREVHVERDWGFLHQPVVWWSDRGSGPPALVQPSDDAALANILTKTYRRPWARIPQISYSQFLTPKDWGYKNVLSF